MRHVLAEDRAVDVRRPEMDAEVDPSVDRVSHEVREAGVRPRRSPGVRSTVNVTWFPKKRFAVFIIELVRQL